ncbi:hypothetical protein [Pseudaminobacter sp. NGMCC 1.201702]|uniref:hypothetical protein n=1 Tax=Pseudaminobacter sp. NGMCC 1.201702 TaxID=3391825 RepID=UPI0039F0E3F3
MSGNSNTDDDFIGIGDVVEHRMNTDVFGVVIGFEGSLLHVRLSPSLVVAKFHEFELRMVEDDEYEPEPKEAEPSNVIKVDFTKRVKLDKNTKTGGAA